MARSTTDVEEMNDDERLLRLEQHHVRDERKMRRWQKLAIAALTVAGTALLAAGRGLLAMGEERGATRVTIQIMQLQIERNREDLEHLRELIYKTRSVP